MKEELICDFCSSPDITRSYLCNDFEMIELGGLHQMSDGGWAACTPCAELIDAGKWEELAQRSVNAFPIPLSPEHRAVYLQMLRDLHQRFKKNMKGSEPWPKNQST